MLLTVEMGSERAVRDSLARAGEKGEDYMLRYESPLVSSLIDDFLKETLL